MSAFLLQVYAKKELDAIYKAEPKLLIYNYTLLDIFDYVVWLCNQVESSVHLAMPAYHADLKDKILSDLSFEGECQLSESNELANWIVNDVVYDLLHRLAKELEIVDYVSISLYALKSWGLYFTVEEDERDSVDRRPATQSGSRNRRVRQRYRL